MEDLIRRDKKCSVAPFLPNGARGPDSYPYCEGRRSVFYIHRKNKRIIDAVSSWWVNLHGHGNKVIAGAVAKQAAQLEHVIFR